MSRSLGVGLFRRPLWRRETDDSRSRMLATITFGYIAARRMVRLCLSYPLCLLHAAIPLVTAVRGCGTVSPVSAVMP